MCGSAATSGVTRDRPAHGCPQRMGGHAGLKVVSDEPCGGTGDAKVVALSGGADTAWSGRSGLASPSRSSRRFGRRPRHDMDGRRRVHPRTHHR